MRTTSLSQRAKAKIRLEMMKKGVTQADLARKMGMTRQNVHRMLSDNETIMLESIEKIAKILGVDPVSFFTL